MSRIFYRKQLRDFYDYVYCDQMEPVPLWLKPRPEDYSGSSVIDRKDGFREGVQIVSYREHQLELDSRIRDGRQSFSTTSTQTVSPGGIDRL